MSKEHPTLREVIVMAEDLIRDYQPAQKPWRVLYLEHVPVLLAAIDDLTRDVNEAAERGGA